MARYFYRDVIVPDALKAAHLDAKSRAALSSLQQAFAHMAWERASIAAAIKSAAAAEQLKPPQVMMPLRVLVAGTVSTPAIDAVLSLLGRDRTRERLAQGLAS